MGEFNARSSIIKDFVSNNGAKDISVPSSIGFDSHYMCRLKVVKL